MTDPKLDAVENTVEKSLIEKAQTPKKAEPPKTDNNAVKAVVTEKPRSTGKGIAGVALLFALLALAGNGGLFYWQSLQQANLNNEINLANQRFLQQNNLTKTQINQDVNQLLAAQQQASQAAFNDVLIKQQQTSAQLLNQLQSALDNISKMQPSDWLIQEAEYLIRVAGRTLWLAHDSKAALGLLRDADLRLQELNDPKYLPIRAVIHQDIETIKQLPVSQAEDVLLSLMALSQQAQTLPLRIEQPKIDDEADLTLSDNVADWRDNLAKTWHKIASYFFTIRVHSGEVEPLLSPAQEKNLIANLALKLQQAQWAASQGKTALYQASLADIQQWLSSYYDMEKQPNQQFYQSLEALKAKLIYVEYPSDLASLQAIRKVIKQDDHSFKIIPENNPQAEPATEENTTVAEPETNQPSVQKSEVTGAQKADTQLTNEGVL